MVRSPRPGMESSRRCWSRKPGSESMCSWIALASCSICPSSHWRWLAIPAWTASRATARRLPSWVRMASSASRRRSWARKACSAGLGAIHASGRRSAQNWAMSLASTRSVLVRTSCEAPKALIWAGLTTLTVAVGRGGKKLRHGLPIGAGGLHTDMDRNGRLLGEPIAQSGKAGRGIGDPLVAELALGRAQRAIELGLGHIDTELKRMHGLSSRDLPCECRLPAGPGRRDCSIYLARVSGGCKDLHRGRQAPGQVRHPAARSRVPSGYAVPAAVVVRGLFSRATRALHAPAQRPNTQPVQHGKIIQGQVAPEGRYLTFHKRCVR